MTDDAFRLGEHNARLDALDGTTTRIERKVDMLTESVEDALLALAEKRGERRAAVYIAGLAATLVSIVIAIVTRVLEHGK